MDDAMIRAIAKLLQQGYGTQMQAPTGDPMLDRQMPDFAAGNVSPLARQVYPGGAEGPLNINPFPIPLQRK